MYLAILIKCGCQDRTPEIQMKMTGRLIFIPSRSVSFAVFDPTLAAICPLLQLGDDPYSCSDPSRNERLKALFESVIAAADSYSEQLENLTIALSEPSA